MTLASGAKFIGHPDCVVSSSLIYADWPEYHELKFIRSRLSATDIIIDVGANVGHLSLLLSDLVAPINIFAFEPTPLTYGRLVKNWQINEWSTEHLFQMAVGAEEGEVEIADVTTPDTVNSVLATKQGVSKVRVQQRSLDSFREQWTSGIGLLKIDVEGYEPQVFAGATQLLRNERPKLIMFESLHGAPPSEVAAVLDQADYKLFQLDHDGTPDFQSTAAQNLFAIPAESIASISI